MFAECTKDYGVLVMDVRASATSRDWHDCVFWYKGRTPSEIPSFSLCDKDFFKLNDYCRVEDHEDRKLKEATQDRVWRLGPDGRIFDAPTGAVGALDADANDSEIELEIVEQRWFRAKIGTV